MLLSHDSASLAELGHKVTSFDQDSDHQNSALPDVSFGDQTSAVAAKADLKHCLSADLQSQINHIVSIADILANTALNAEQRTFVSMISRGSRALAARLSDLVDISQLDEGVLEITAEPFDLPELIDDIDLIFSAQARDKSLEFTTHIQDDLPHMLIGDGKRLRQILNGVLSQAIKNTERGSVALHVSADVTDSDDQLSIVIENSASNEASTSDELNLAEAILQLMGGVMQVEDNDARGRVTTIALSMPVVEVVNNISHMTEHLQGVRILLLAGDSNRNKDLVANLNNWGLDACLVGDGAIASVFMQAAGKIRTGVDVLLAEQTLFQNYLADAAPDDVLATYAKSRVILFANADELAEVDFAALQNYAACLTEPLESESILVAIADALEDSRLVMETPQTTPVTVTEVTPQMAEENTRMHIVPPSLQPLDRDVEAPFDASDDEPMGFDVIQFEMDAAELPEVTSHVDIEVVPHATRSSQIDVLIVEDNEINQLVYAQILSKVDVAYQVVDSADAFLAEFYDLSPRLVLLDTSLPDMDGFTVAQNLRDSGHTWGINVPIIGVVAPGKGEDRDACIAARMDDCLAKPISPKTLLAKIEYWLDRSANQSVA